jgi:hypothetical protein
VVYPLPRATFSLLTDSTHSAKFSIVSRLLSTAQINVGPLRKTTFTFINVGFGHDDTHEIQATRFQYVHFSIYLSAAINMLIPLQRAAHPRHVPQERCNASGGGTLNVRGHRGDAHWRYFLGTKAENFGVYYKTRLTGPTPALIGRRLTHSWS